MDADERMLTPPPTADGIRRSGHGGPQVVRSKRVGEKPQLCPETDPGDCSELWAGIHSCRISREEEDVGEFRKWLRKQYTGAPEQRCTSTRVEDSIGCDLRSSPLEGDAVCQLDFTPQVSDIKLQSDSRDSVANHSMRGDGQCTPGMDILHDVITSPVGQSVPSAVKMVDHHLFGGVGTQNTSMRSDGQCTPGMDILHDVLTSPVGQDWHNKKGPCGVCGG